MEFFNHIVSVAVTFIQNNHQWAAPVAFAVAFAESLAFLSLIFPGSAILVAASLLIGASNISFWPIWLAAGLGGSLGYAVSYWIGVYFKNDLPHMWPFRNSPDMLPKGHKFFERWGILSVFFGHFFGPVRAVIPVVAGVVQMPHLHFQVANVSSAFLWSLGVMAPGAFGIKWLPAGLLG